MKQKVHVLPVRNRLLLKLSVVSVECGFFLRNLCLFEGKLKRPESTSASASPLCSEAQGDLRGEASAFRAPWTEDTPTEALPSACPSPPLPSSEVSCGAGWLPRTPKGVDRACLQQSLMKI